jgi:hypothetical protein
MNAELRVPSPNILRKRLGIVKARIKAPPIGDTPKQVKKRISRNRPSIRDRIVSELTTEIFFTKPDIEESF